MAPPLSPPMSPSSPRSVVVAEVTSGAEPSALARRAAAHLGAALVSVPVTDAGELLPSTTAGAESRALLSIGPLPQGAMEAVAPGDAVAAWVTPVLPEGVPHTSAVGWYARAQHLLADTHEAVERARQAGWIPPDRPVTVAPVEALLARLPHEMTLARLLAIPKPPPPGTGSFRSTVLRKGAAALATARLRSRPPPPVGASPRYAVVRFGFLGDHLLVDPLLAALASDAGPVEVVADDADHVPPWMREHPDLRYRHLAVRSPDGWSRPWDAELRRSLAALEETWASTPPDVLVFADEVTTPTAAHLQARVAQAAPTAHRVGLAGPATPPDLLDASAPVDSAGRHELHRMECLAALAQGNRYLPPKTPPLPRVPTGGGEGRAGDGVRAVLHMFASSPVRRWPAEGFRALATELNDRLGAEIVLVGSPADRAAMHAAGVGWEDAEFVRDLVGRVPLHDLPALFRSADLFVGNDSFPFHLGVASGIPTVGIVGPGARRFYDYPHPHVHIVREPLVCSPRQGEECPWSTTCPHAACIHAPRTEQVLEAALSLLRRTGFTAPSDQVTGGPPAP